MHVIEMLSRMVGVQRLTVAGFVDREDRQCLRFHAGSFANIAQGFLDLGGSVRTINVYCPSPNGLRIETNGVLGVGGFNGSNLVQLSVGQDLVLTNGGRLSREGARTAFEAIVAGTEPPAVVAGLLLAPCA